MAARIEHPSELVWHAGPLPDPANVLYTGLIPRAVVLHRERDGSALLSATAVLAWATPSERRWAVSGGGGDVLFYAWLAAPLNAKQLSNPAAPGTPPAAIDAALPIPLGTSKESKMRTFLTKIVPAVVTVFGALCMGFGGGQLIESYKAARAPLPQHQRAFFVTEAPLSGDLAAQTHWLIFDQHNKRVPQRFVNDLERLRDGDFVQIHETYPAWLDDRPVVSERLSRGQVEALLERPKVLLSELSPFGRTSSVDAQITTKLLFVAPQ